MIKPLVPTGFATAELAAKYPQVFKVGDPIGYVRPEGSAPNTRKRRKRNMSDTDTTEVTETETATKKPPRKKRTPKAEAKPKVPKAAWKEPADLVQFKALAHAAAHRGDKKWLARAVQYAIEMRMLCKSLIEGGDVMMAVPAADEVVSEVEVEEDDSVEETDDEVETSEEV